MPFPPRGRLHQELTTGARVGAGAGWPGSRSFIYGVTEVVVGLIATWSTIHSSTADMLSKGLGFFGGIYIVVRGLDNMDRDLPTKLRPLWDRCFPKVKRYAPGSPTSMEE